MADLWDNHVDKVARSLGRRGAGYSLKMCPNTMSDGSPGIVQRLQDKGAKTLREAKRLLRSAAAHVNFPTGYYWVEDPRGVPLYGIYATEQPKMERVPLTKHNPDFPGSAYQGFTTRKVPGQVQRVLQAGNMPWNR